MEASTRGTRRGRRGGAAAATGRRAGRLWLRGARGLHCLERQRRWRARSVRRWSATCQHGARRLGRPPGVHIRR